MDNPLRGAPKDRRFLVKTHCQVFGFKTRKWERSGTKWVEAWWDGFEYRIWCGSKSRRTTEPLDPIVWIELPREFINA